MKLLQKYHVSRWRGAGFPPISSENSPVNIQQDMKLVESSLLQIFNTSSNERVMYPSFGSKLKSIQWDPNDDFLEQDIEYYISEAIAFWEPRVIFVSVNIEQSAYYKNNNVVLLNITVRLKNNPDANYTVSIPVETN